MKSEEKSIKAISAQAHGEAADNRLLRKKLREKDELISDHERSKDCIVLNVTTQHPLRMSSFLTVLRQQVLH